MKNGFMLIETLRMGKTEKKLNKWLIGAIIGTTLLWVWGLSMTPKGRSFWWKAKDFFKSGVDELKKELKKLEDEEKKQKSEIRDQE